MAQKKFNTNNGTAEIVLFEGTSLSDNDISLSDTEMLSFNEIEVDVKEEHTQSSETNKSNVEDENGFIDNRRRRCRVQKCLITQIGKRIQTLERRTGMISCLIYMKGDEMVIEGNKDIIDTFREDEAVQDSFKRAVESINSKNGDQHKQPEPMYGSLDLNPPKTERITVAFLRKVITKAVSLTTTTGHANSFPKWGNQHCRPAWWPVDIPFLSPASGSCGLRKEHLLQVYNSLKTYLTAQQTQASSAVEHDRDLPSSVVVHHNDHSYHFPESDNERSEATTQTEEELSVSSIMNHSSDFDGHEVVTNNTSVETCLLQQDNNDIIVIIDQNQPIVIDTHGNTSCPATSVDSHPVTSVDSHPVTSLDFQPVTSVDCHPVTSLDSQPVTSLDSFLTTCTSLDSHPVTSVDSFSNTNVDSRPAACVGSHPSTDIDNQSMVINTGDTSPSEQTDNL